MSKDEKYKKTKDMKQENKTYEVREVPTTMISKDYLIECCDVLIRNGVFMFYVDACSNDLVASFPVNSFTVRVLDK